MGHLILGLFVISGTLFFIRAQMNESKKKSSFVEYNNLQPKKKKKKKMI